MPHTLRTEGLVVGGVHVTMSAFIFIKTLGLLRTINVPAWTGLVLLEGCRECSELCALKHFNVIKKMSLPLKHGQCKVVARGLFHESVMKHGTVVHENALWSSKTTNSMIQHIKDITQGSMLYTLKTWLFGWQCLQKDRWRGFNDSSGKISPRVIASISEIICI